MFHALNAQLHKILETKMMCALPVATLRKFESPLLFISGPFIECRRRDQISKTFRFRSQTKMLCCANSATIFVEPDSGPLASQLGTRADRILAFDVQFRQSNWPSRSNGRKRLVKALRRIPFKKNHEARYADSSIHRGDLVSSEFNDSSATIYPLPSAPRQL